MQEQGNTTPRSDLLEARIRFLEDEADTLRKRMQTQLARKKVDAKDALKYRLVSPLLECPVGNIPEAYERLMAEFPKENPRAALPADTSIAAYAEAAYKAVITDVEMEAAPLAAGALGG